MVKIKNQGRKAVSKVYLDVVELSNNGTKPCDIAQLLDLDSSMVYTMRNRARKRGDLVDSYKNYTNSFFTLKNLAKDKNLRWGGMKDYASMLTREQHIWVVNNIPEGMSITEFVASIVVDAINEEQVEEQT